MSMRDKSLEESGAIPSTRAVSRLATGMSARNEPLAARGSGVIPPNAPLRFSHFVLVALCGLIASAAGCNRRPQLTTVVHGGSSPPTLVLLHGYGSSAERWMPFTQTIRWPAGG